MDFKGQQLAEQVCYLLILTSGGVGFCCGFLLQSFRVMMQIYTAGILVALLATVPDWPWYNRHPLKWRSPAALSPDEQQQDQGGRKVLKSAS